MAKPSPDAIPLVTKSVDIVHVDTHVAGKVPAVCVTVEDDANLDVFLEATPVTDTLRRYIITHVQPSHEHDEVVTVFFRTQTVEEVVALEREMVLSSSVSEEMGSEAVQELLAQMFNGELQVTDGTAQAKVEEILDELEAEARKHDRPNLTFSLQLSLAEAHLTQVLGTETNAAAFVITSDEFTAWDDDGRTPEWEDFVGLVDYPEVNDPGYFESISLMLEKITGQRAPHIHIENTYRIFAETLDLLGRFSDGDANAVKEAFRLWNEGNRFFKHMNDADHSLDRDDARIATIREAVKELYLATDPRNLSRLLRGQMEPQHAEEILAQYQEENEFRQLLSDAGLENTLKEILLERYEQTGFSLSAEPSSEEVQSYYATPFSKSTFPPEWDNIQHLIQLPLLSEYDWAGGEIPELHELEKNGYGAAVVAMVITVAARINRLNHIHAQGALKVVPLEVLLKPLSPRGDASWAVAEGAAMAVRGKPHLLRTFLQIHLPSSNEEVASNPNILLEAPVTSIAHTVLHAIRAEGFSADMMASRLIDEPNVKEFIGTLLHEVENIYARQLEALQEAAESGEELDEHERGACASMQGMFTVLRAEDNYPMMVDGTLGLLKAFSELVSLKRTNFEPESSEWVEFQKSVARDIFSSDDD